MARHAWIVRRPLLKAAPDMTMRRKKRCLKSNVATQHVRACASLAERKLNMSIVSLSLSLQHSPTPIDEMPVSS